MDNCNWGKKLLQNNINGPLEMFIIIILLLLLNNFERAFFSAPSEFFFKPFQICKTASFVTDSIRGALNWPESARTHIHMNIQIPGPQNKRGRIHCTAALIKYTIWDPVMRLVPDRNFYDSVFLLNQKKSEIVQ